MGSWSKTRHSTDSIVGPSTDLAILEEFDAKDSYVQDITSPSRRRIVFIAAAALVVVGAAVAVVVTATQSDTAASVGSGSGPFQTTPVPMSTPEPTTTSTTTAPPLPPPAIKTTGLASIVSSDLFLQLFPKALAVYKYDHLVSVATAKYPEFAASGNVDNDKREVAAFLGQLSLESGNLTFVEEVKKADMCQ
ncbi:hypothetical protein As57867_003724, partial [Aphanomyces stellatus]